MAFILKEDHQLTQDDLSSTSLQPSRNLLFFSLLTSCSSTNEQLLKGHRDERKGRETKNLSEQ
jgi:hypothetical protein